MKIKKHPLIGHRVLVRGESSGIHIGLMTDHSPRLGAVLQDCQRIFSWQGALDSCALAAVGPTSAKISPAVTMGVISDARDIYALSAPAESAIAKIGVWRHGL